MSYSSDKENYRLMKAPVKRPLGKNLSKRKQWSPNKEVDESNFERLQNKTILKSAVLETKFSTIAKEKDDSSVQKSNQSLENTIGNNNKNNWLRPTGIGIQFTLFLSHKN